VSKLRLFVVRHGETAWSRERRFAGSRDVALEPEGLRQCEAVARALASQVVAAVYASPLERARASAELIAKPHRLPVEIDPAFGEMAFGEWEGLTREEVAARFPAAYEEWRHAPHLVRIAGGETLSQVAERARGAVQALAASHTGETIVLVTHAIVTRLIVLATGTDADVQENMFKLVDRETGRLLALRADITPQIARIVATRLRDEPKPIRLAYVTNVFRYDEPQVAHYREFYQAGVELIGL